MQRVSDAWLKPEGFLYFERRVVYSILANCAASCEVLLSSLDIESKSRDSKKFHSSSGDMREFFMSWSKASKHWTSIRTASL